MCSRNEDLPRFIKFFDEKIKEGVIETCKKYKQTRNKVTLLQEERVEAKNAKNKLKEKK